MSLPADYLQYPRRRYGMDQDWYDWRSHFAIPKQAWPNGARVAIWISTALEFFPLNPTGKPFKAPGSMVTPYPDLRHYTTRDYGNRVGVYRLLRLFSDLGIRGSFAVNAAVAERYPVLIEDVLAGQHELIAHGVDMDRLHHGGLNAVAEGALIDQSLAALKSVSGRSPRGWLSPARSESAQTPQLLAERGIEYLCDFVNDELPYPFRTASGELTAMPMSFELSDRQILLDYHHSEDEYSQQLLDQFERLQSESREYGRRILSVPLTPYITGLPYRIGALRKVLTQLAAQPGVWFATGEQLLDAWRVTSV